MIISFSDRVEVQKHVLVRLLEKESVFLKQIRRFNALERPEQELFLRA